MKRISLAALTGALAISTVGLAIDVASAAPRDGAYRGGANRVGAGRVGVNRVGVNRVGVAVGVGRVGVGYGRGVDMAVELDMAVAHWRIVVATIAPDWVSQLARWSARQRPTIRRQWLLWQQWLRRLCERRL